MNAASRCSAMEMPECARVRDRAADEGDISSGQPNVRNELPAAAHEAIVFLSDQTSPDTLCGHCDAAARWGSVISGSPPVQRPAPSRWPRREGSSNGPADRCAA